MTKNRRLAIGIMGLLLGLGGASRGLAYVNATIAQYQHAAPCGRLSGVPGLLQATHFIPSGDCKVRSDGSCQGHGACNISAPPSGSGKGGSKGHCTTTNENTCVCE